MSFGGPIDSMINSNRSNLRQLRKRKGLKEIQQEYGSTKNTLPSNKKLSETQRLEIKQQIGQIKKRRRKAQLISAVITLVLFLLLVYILIKADFSEILEVID